ncbi:hypothetical protein SDC9_178730 [bioreactor metagenome]|uniref:Uncharacterized protein n=1 Tax=bioreactor metagenome TaxID=1076179 RepID=A0A645GYC7_9ZZZZ
MINQCTDGTCGAGQGRGIPSRPRTLGIRVHALSENGYLDGPGNICQLRSRRTDRDPDARLLGHLFAYLRQLKGPVAVNLRIRFEVHYHCGLRQPTHFFRTSR